MYGAWEGAAEPWPSSRLSGRGPASTRAPARRRPHQTSRRAENADSRPQSHRWAPRQETRRRRQFPGRGSRTGGRSGWTPGGTDREPWSPTPHTLQTASHMNLHRATESAPPPVAPRPRPPHARPTPASPLSTAHRSWRGSASSAPAGQASRRLLRGKTCVPEQRTTRCPDAPTSACQRKSPPQRTSATLLPLSPPHRAGATHDGAR
mmetsp:Transcript_83170/g.239024  ORF Transcript_83170/g.239024 Transcript_83170/m.239024 type:complete len:207 (+) Transcript_83170:361-981(+)